MTSPTILSIAKPIKLKTTKIINGMWSADMQIQADSYIAPESYIDIDSEEYVVKSLKKIKSRGSYYYDVKLYHNAIEELSALTIDRFSYLKTASDLLTLILTGTGWTAGTVNIDETISLVADRRVSVLEALNLLADRCGGELYFYSKTRVVDLKREVGTDTRLQIRYDKNADYIEKEQDSSKLVTRIYPYGPDNYSINTTTLDDCEDESLYTASGAGTKAASTLKRNYTQGIELSFAALNETFIRDLGAGYVIDLTSHDLLKFWIYSATDNASGVTFGIGESAYTENTVNTGALVAGCWHEISLDLSGVADGDKDAIRYVGFKNLTSGAAVVVVDMVRAFSGNVYLESDNLSLYKVAKEYAYFHSAKPQKTSYEIFLYPTDDATVSQELPNNNYGSATSMTIKALTSYNWIALLKWDFSTLPTDAVIVSATIGLNVASVFGFGGAPDGDSVESFLNTSDFDEDTVTYNTIPTDTGSNINTFTMTSTGVKTADFKTQVENWISGVADNYGIKLKGTTSGANQGPILSSKEDTANKPYIQIVYSLVTDPEPVIKAAGQAYLDIYDEPILKYKIKMSNLSEVIIDTWEDETINIGDTVKIYDADLGLNVNVRVKKITKDLLEPGDIEIELTNKSANAADEAAARAKQLSYAMPYQDNATILDANAMQVGYFGSDVNA